MHFDFTLNVPTLAGLITSLLVVISRMSKMEVKVDTMWSSYIRNRRVTDDPLGTRGE